MYEGLNKEQTLLIYLSRVTFNDTVKNKIIQICNENIDWYIFFALAVNNKVILLVWHNLKKFNLENKLPSKLRKVIEFYYIGNKQRNSIYLDEMNIISKAMQKCNISCAPLKGGYLLKNLYKDIGMRQINDIDYMISRKDRENIEKVMQELGYKQGDYDDNSRDIELISRDKSILWKMKMNNMYPFRKINNLEYSSVLEFDFSFSLDLDLNFDMVDKILLRATINDDTQLLQLNSCDFFIHLCCHLYKEATNAIWVTFGQDINLIKFCDVILILNKMIPQILEICYTKIG